jgi:hypothetical protein
MRCRHPFAPYHAPARYGLFLALGLLAVTLLLRGVLMADTRSVVRAPEFPQGLQWFDIETPPAGKLYIADTNNHAIRVADMASGVVTTLALQGLPAPGVLAGFHTTGFGTEGAIQVIPQPVQAGAAGRLTIDLQFPDGYHLNPFAPLSYRLHVSGTGIDIAEPYQQMRGIALSLPLLIPFQAAPGTHRATLDIEMTFYFCREDNTGVCAIRMVHWLVPLYTVSAGHTPDPVVSYKVEAPILHKQL